VTDDGEASLVSDARAGNARAFGLLVDRHQQAVRGFLRRLSGRSADADDMAQEAFVRAFLQLRRYEGRSGFRTFVCGIAYRIWQGHNRSSRRERLREEAYSEASMIERPPALDIDLHLSLLKAMDTLPAEQRAALALCLGAEFSHAEAAQVMGLPIGTVKSHVARGRARLRAALGEPDDGREEDTNDA
jgi:RNA polymerase sigma-70 factor (ECF subfamily)